MTNDIHAMKPDARKAALAATSELRDKKILFKVTSTARTDDEQFALYLQNRVSLDIVNLARKKAKMFAIGEKENTWTVTDSDGVNFLSDHQKLIGIDVVPVGSQGGPIWPANEDPRWAEIAAVMKKHGFAWGGEWMKPDPAHYSWRSA